MKTPFNRAEGLIIVAGVCRGPRRRQPVRLIVDTGANVTTLKPGLIRMMGYRSEDIVADGTVMTAGGKREIEVVVIEELSVLGVTRKMMPVVQHRLELEADGILGLDFFHDSRLTIDMRKGTVEVD
ncbi:MAG: retropepsin-like aspartic protease [Phycisphaeraceae bacterium]